MNLNLVITRINDTEVDAMVAMAEGFGLPYHVFTKLMTCSWATSDSSADAPAEAVVAVLLNAILRRRAERSG